MEVTEAENQEAGIGLMETLGTTPIGHGMNQTTAEEFKINYLLIMGHLADGMMTVNGLNIHSSVKEN